MRYLAAVIVFIFFTLTTLYADTVIMKEEESVKGLVVEEYVDRITLSTVDGEKNIFRKEIQRIEYDTPEQNFIQLGRAYDANGRYDKAAFYYKKAIEMNPDYKEAKELYLASHAKMWRQEERMTNKELERQKMVMDWWKSRNKENAIPSKDNSLLLKEVIGISLLEKDGIFIIDKIRPYSSAAKAGIEEGDFLVGIWAKLIGHSKMEDVIDELLLGPRYSEVRILVEKEISIPKDGNEKNLYKDLGLLLDFEYEGLIIKDVIGGKKGLSAGFQKGDFVIAIDKNITRYLSLDDVIALIDRDRNNSRDIIFTIRRTVNLRREGK